MSTVEPVNATASPTAQALAATQAAASGSTGSQAQKSGLPPVGLARASSINTVNAQLVSSQWGVDPATVSGVYGGAAESSGLFSGDNLLPLLTTISHAHAEQALSLLGIQTPRPGTAAAATGSTSSAVASKAYAAAQTQSALVEAASGSGPAIIDPLWGRTA
jgi:hypothetical protein